MDLTAGNILRPPLFKIRIALMVMSTCNNSKMYIILNYSFC